MEANNNYNNNSKIEIPISDEIRELGFTNVYLLKDKKDQYIEVVHPNFNCKGGVQCPYRKKKNGLRELALELVSLLQESGFDEKIAKKFTLLFTKDILKFEEQSKKTYRDHIIGEILERRKNHINLSQEEWKTILAEKYRTLQNTVKDNIPEMWIGLEFVLSILRILNIHDCTLPFIGILLGRPSSYKTQIIKLLTKWYCCYYTDDFTAKSFVSHSTSVSEEELAEIDMLPKIKNRLFLTPELAPTFTVKDEDLAKTIGMITRIADGHGFVSNSGAHGQRGYKEDMMFTWIGAAVDIPYKVYKMLSVLGFKLYFFRLPFKEATEDDLLEQMSEDFSDKINKIETALYEYLYYFEMGPEFVYNNELHKVGWDTSKDDADAKMYIVKLGILLQHLRCIAITWHTEGTQESDYSYSVSQPEAPIRAIRLLQNLARGHALSQGRNYLTVVDIPVVVKCVLSTAQIERVSFFYLLINNDGDISTDQIMEYLHVSRPTALRTMAELKAIKLVDSYDFDEHQKGDHFVRHIKLKDKFAWFLSAEFKELCEDFVPVDNKQFMQDKSTNKEKNTPYGKPILTQDQLHTFWSVFKEMEDEQSQVSVTEIDKDTISGELLKQKLVMTGKFHEKDALRIIEGMKEFGNIETISYDTYRRKERGKENLV
jgi:predicted transcriptional regulator